MNGNLQTLVYNTLVVTDRAPAFKCDPKNRKSIYIVPIS